MKRLTPVKAIRAKCLDCSNGQQKEVRECSIKKCPLYPYRMGKRPKAEENIEEEVQIENSGAMCHENE